MAGLERYQPVSLLARGGMAEVYLGHERLPDGGERRVVVKRILPEHANDPDFRIFFEQEAKVALALQHPNVVASHAFGHDGGAPYLVMEYVAGQTLVLTMRRASALGHRLSLGAIVKVGLDVAAALDHVHGARDASGRPLGIVHRDVSPHNVMLGYDGIAKLVDFGIARSRTQAFHTRTGVVKGKFAYIAPEMLAGRKFDHRVDLYGLGIIMWEMLAGRQLFRGRNDKDTLARVRVGTVPPITELRSDCPPELAKVVARLLHPSPSGRPRAAAAVVAALEAAASFHGIDASAAAFAEELDVLFPVGASRELRLGEGQGDDDEVVGADDLGSAATVPLVRHANGQVIAPVRDFVLERFLRLASQQAGDASGAVTLALPAAAPAGATSSLGIVVDVASLSEMVPGAAPMIPSMGWVSWPSLGEPGGLRCLWLALVLAAMLIMAVFILHLSP